jgi:hypothetical protein
VVLAALGKRDSDLANDPDATVFGEPEQNAVKRQAVRVWTYSLLTGAVLAAVVWVAVIVVR